MLERITELKERRAQLKSDLDAIDVAIQSEIGAAEAQLRELRRALAPHRKDRRGTYVRTAETRAKMRAATLARHARARQNAA